MNSIRKSKFHQRPDLTHDPRDLSGLSVDPSTVYLLLIRIGLNERFVAKKPFVRKKITNTMNLLTIGSNSQEVQ